MHSERVEHFPTTLEADGLALLPDGESGENWHDSVLSKREAVVGMPGHLKYEMSVPPLEKKLTRWRPADRQAAHVACTHIAPMRRRRDGRFYCLL